MYLSKILKMVVGVALFLLLIGTASAEYQFSRNLYYGLRRDVDVVKLQEFLKQQGYLPGSVTATGNYLNLTVEGVKKFQVANSIKPASGYFGPLTRAAVNRLINITGATIYTPPQKNTATSTYWGKIKINWADRGDTPEYESLTIENVSSGDEKIDVTGFKLVNSTGEEFVLPRAHNLPGVSATPQDDIVLSSYDSVRVITGRQDKQMNFRENLCTGYLDQTSDFHGALSHNCPRPSSSTYLSLPDHCISIFDRTQSCRTVDQTKIQVSQCVAYADAHYNYQGCVNDNKGRKDFYRDDWLVWMQRSEKFLRSLHDKITLYDRDGNIVSTYSY